MKLTAMVTNTGWSAQVGLVFGFVLVTTRLALFLFSRRQRLKVSAINAFMAPYRQGDFQAALQAVEGMRNDARAYCFFRGALLAQLGDLKEAESLLHQSIQLSEQREEALRARGQSAFVFGRIGAKEALERQRKLTALSRSTLGEVYLDQERYADALACFQASLRDWPGHASSYRAIAETLLRRGDNASEAVKWAQLAVDAERASKAMPQEVRDTNLGEQLATLAWATATASHDRAQVDRLVEEAESAVGSRVVTSCAQVQYLSGLAYATLGDTAQSARHMEEAARIDPHGRWGRAARTTAGVGT